MKKKNEKEKKFFENDKMEQFLGIESTEIIYNNRFNDDYFRYEPTSYCGLIAAFDELSTVVSRYDRLVDFGCGKGRVLFYVNQRFRCEVCGIEIDKDVYEMALDNRAYFNTRFRDSMEQIEIINGKAEDYEVTPKDTIFYFFNPFEINIFEKVMKNVMESVEKNPRHIFVMMYYPKEEYRTFLRYNGFSLYRLVKLPSYNVDYDEKVVIYEYGNVQEESPLEETKY